MELPDRHIVGVAGDFQLERFVFQGDRHGMQHFSECGCNSALPGSNKHIGIDFDADAAPALRDPDLALLHQRPHHLEQVAGHLGHVRLFFDRFAVASACAG